MGNPVSGYTGSGATVVGGAVSATVVSGMVVVFATVAAVVADVEEDCEELSLLLQPTMLVASTPTSARRSARLT